MKLTPLFQVARRSAILVSGAVTMCLVACHDEPTAPTPGSRGEIRGPKAQADTVATDDSPDIAVLQLPPPDEYNGFAALTSGMPRYPHPTVVRADVTGFVTYTPNFANIGPPQGPFGPSGNTVLAWTDGVTNNVVRFVQGGFVEAQVTTHILFTGAGKVTAVQRNALGTLTLLGYRPVIPGPFIFCGPGQGRPCFSYGGDAGKFVLTRLDANLFVKADSTEVSRGSTPSFEFRATPQIVEDQQLPFVVDSTAWVPDSATAGGDATDLEVRSADTGACQQEFRPACKRRMIGSGTFFVSAWVNGKLITKSVHINVGEKRVKITAPATVEPSVSRYDFTPETKKYKLLSTDSSTRRVTVSVVDGGGKLVPNALVTLHLTAWEGLAGHEHRGGKPAGGLSQTTVNTGSSGQTVVTFVAPEVSGPVSIHGASDGAKEDSAVVSVQLDGLEPFPTGDDYEFTGEIPGMHTDNHWIAAGYTPILQDFAKQVRQIVGEPLGINDISLKFGGLFDVDVANHWTVPHSSHRQGTGADIRIRHKNDVLWAPGVYNHVMFLWNEEGLGTPVKESDNIHLNFIRKSK